MKIEQITESPNNASPFFRRRNSSHPTYVPETIRSVSVFLTENTDDETPTTCIGVENHRIEMLFVDPDYF